jgi:hypothetical protein
MFWWHCAAQLLSAGKIERFGFITTNSLTQTFNRRVLEAHLGAAMHLAYAIPDHPWVDSADGAAVRVAMTVAAPGTGDGQLLRVTTETPGVEGEVNVELLETSGLIHANLQIGANVAAAKPLQANEQLANRGFQLIGAGFIVTPEQAAALLPSLFEGGAGGEGEAGGEGTLIRAYRNGRDLTDKPRGVMVIDAWGYAEAALREQQPAVWQWLRDRVKPERDHNARAGYRDNWWLFGEPRRELRKMLHGLPRYIATVETAKHRVFQFLDATIAPDNKLICIAHDDAYVLGVLSSRVHVVWALAAGSTLEDRPVYVKTTCFEPFPFPTATPEQQLRIRELAETLDAHRKRQQAAHPELTLTGVYNVLEKLRSGAALTAKDKLIHEHGLVSVLKQLHDELDSAVLAAYGWADNSDLLDRLVALNTARAAEEADGQVRWLRPALQQPVAAPAASHKLDMPDTADAHPTLSAAVPWPADLPGQLGAVAQALRDAAVPLSPNALAARFTGKRNLAKTLPGLLDALAAVARARQHEDGRWSAG